MSGPVSLSNPGMQGAQFDIEELQTRPETTSRVAHYAGIAFMSLGVVVSVGGFLLPHLIKVTWIDSSVASGLGVGLGGVIALGGCALFIHKPQGERVNEIRYTQDPGMTA